MFCRYTSPCRTCAIRGGSITAAPRAPDRPAAPGSPGKPRRLAARAQCPSTCSDSRRSTRSVLRVRTGVAEGDEGSPSDAPSCASASSAR